MRWGNLGQNIHGIIIFSVLLSIIQPNKLFALFITNETEADVFPELFLVIPSYFS